MGVTRLILGCLLVGALLQPVDLRGQGTFHGRRAELVARIPRVDGVAAIDGVLDEAAWQTAARLTGFSSYLPFDGRPAQDSTEVLVWYSSSAIYFGIRAFESHGAVHATLAAHRIDTYVQLLIDPSTTGGAFGVLPGAGDGRAPMGVAATHSRAARPSAAIHPPTSTSAQTSSSSPRGTSPPGGTRWRCAFLSRAFAFRAPTRRIGRSRSSAMYSTRGTSRPGRRRAEGRRRSSCSREHSPGSAACAAIPWWS